MHAIPVPADWEAVGQFGQIFVSGISVNKKIMDMKMNDKTSAHSGYWRFGLMMIVSFVVMYAVMYLNANRWSEVFPNLSQTYMILLMTSSMAVVMLLFMWKMYHNRLANFIILGVSILVFVFSLWGIRTQAGVGDIQWLRGMIPHHSMAILPSSKADLKDPEVRKLAEEIIRQQEREIAEMKAMLDRLKNER